MKARITKIVISSVAALLIVVFGILLIAGVFSDKNDNGPFDLIDYTLGDKKILYGEDPIFEEAIGWANSDPACIQLDDGTRYVYYTANLTMWEGDYGIVCRKGTLVNGKYEYTDRRTVLTPSESGWDSGIIGSADIVKGSFSYSGKTYSYLMAYQANDNPDRESCYRIGLAVSNEPDKDWVKVGNEPILTNDDTENGADVLGFYAPSLVSCDKAGKVKLFYTYGDAYGHFQYFGDLDCTNLNSIPAFGTILISGTGISGGDTITMFPNADFMYDSATERFYVVKDYSPSATDLPRKANQIELAYVKEVNLYTADYDSKFNSLQIVNGITVMGERDGWERIYSGSIVTDQYGWRLDDSEIEVLYSACDIYANDPIDYMFTPSVHSYIYTD